MSHPITTTAIQRIPTTSPRISSVTKFFPNQGKAVGANLEKPVYLNEGYKQNFVNSIDPIARGPLMAMGPGIFTGIFLNLALPYFALRFMNESNKTKIKLPGKPDQYTKDSLNYGAAQAIFETALQGSWNFFVKRPYSLPNLYENLYKDYYISFAEKNEQSTKELADNARLESQRNVSQIMI